MSPKIESEPDVLLGSGDNSYHRDGGEEYGNSKLYSPSGGYQVKDTYHPAPEPSYERDIGTVNFGSIDNMIFDMKL